MKILIFKTPDTLEFVFKRALELVEMLNLDLLGFVHLVGGDKTDSFMGYPVYAFADLNKLEWDLALYDANCENIRGAFLNNFPP